MNLINTNAIANRLCNSKDPQRGRVAQFVADIIELECARIEASHADVEHAYRLLDDFRKRAADRHDLAHAFHFSADAC